MVALSAARQRSAGADGRAVGKGPAGPWRLCVASAEERARYDAFVDGHTRGHPLQLWSWGEVKRGDGWTPLRLILERAGQAEAALSVVERRLPGGLGFWWAHRGPVVEPMSLAAAALWPRLRRLAAARAVVAVRLDPEWSLPEAAHLAGPGWRRLPVRAGWYAGALEPLRVWRISLAGGLDGVVERFEPHTRRDVRLALRRAVTIRPAAAADLPAFYALEYATSRRKGFALRSLEFFERLWRAWNEEGRGELFLAEHEGRVVGGAWWLFCGRGAWGEFVATDPRARRQLPAVALYWHGIRRAHERGAAFLDFGGIGHREDPSDGLWSFKKGFGPGDTRFVGDIDLVVRPAAYRAFRFAEELRWAWCGARARAARAPWPGLGAPSTG